MLNCPYNNTCIKSSCDLACGEFSEFEHWRIRNGLTLNNPVVKADYKQLMECYNILEAARSDTNTTSNFNHIGIYSGQNPQYTADLITYIAICYYCKDIGFYQGVYELNFLKYLDEIKASWNTRSDSELLSDMKIWIQSSKYLVICNMGLVRFGDFESQTLLSIFQERYSEDKYTILVLDGGKFALPGKPDSLFYNKLKKEITDRGVNI